MEPGRVLTATTLAALVLTGCFNPPVKDETGAASEADETAAPSTASTDTTAVPTSSGGETTVDVCPPGGCTTDTGMTSTTGPSSLLFMQLPVVLAGAMVPATLDIDEDPTHDDLVVTSATAAKFYYFAAGSLTPFEQPAGAALALAVEDVAAGTRDDVWLAQLGMPAKVARHINTGGVFAETVLDLPGNCATPVWMATGRIDQDSLVDVAIACKEYPDGIFAAFGAVDGIGPTVMPIGLGMATAAGSLALVDVRDSAADDLIVVSSGANKVQVYVGNADTTFLPAQDFDVIGATGLAIGHLDVDERADAGVIRVGSATCDLFFGGPEGLANPKALACGDLPVDIAFADMDGDELDDIVTLHLGELRIHSNPGSANFGAPVVVPVPESAVRIALGNYVGDAGRDIAVTSIDTLTIYEQVAI